VALMNQHLDMENLLTAIKLNTVSHEAKRRKSKTIARFGLAPFRFLS